MSTGETFEDEERDSRFFGLLSALVNEHQSRYEVQTEKLLREKHLKVICNQIEIEYWLTPKGFSFRFTKPTGYEMGSWTRTGWRRSSKRQQLPNLFATSEASALIDELN